MNWQIPSNTHAAGDTGHISDHDNMADVLTDLANANRSLYYAPTGATAETFTRAQINGGSAAMTSGTLYLMAIGLHQNIPINNITFATKGTAVSGLTHGWYVLLDSGLVVRAVTADQLTSGTFLSATNTAYTLATGAYTTTYSGLYYVGIMVTAGTTMPQMAIGGAVPGAVGLLAPAICGASSTGQTTAPSTGTTMAAISASGSFSFYAYTS